MSVGLVLEGGGMRGSYTAGVLSAFEDNGCSVRGTKKDILDTIRENT